jgi:tetratricopeptide (TPR) repeat protein
LLLRQSAGEDGLSPDLFSHIDLFYYHAGATAGELGNLLESGRQGGMALPAGIKPIPDKSSRLIALINMGAAYLNQGKPELAVNVLENVKAHIAKQLSPKHTAGCSYNLGMAYRRAGRRTDALRQFTEVGDIYPSIFARLAEKARKATRRPEWRPS